MQSVALARWQCCEQRSNLSVATVLSGAALALADGLGAGIQTDQRQEPGKEGKHEDSIPPASGSHAARLHHKLIAGS